MAIISTHRRASLEEVVAEMDRRGKVIEGLEARLATHPAGRDGAGTVDAGRDEQPHSHISWNGFNVHGDAKSISEVKRGIRAIGRDESQTTLIRHQQDEIGKLHARLATLTQGRDGGAVPEELREIIDRFPELNMANYDHDGVNDLNNWGIEVYQAVRGDIDLPPPERRCKACNGFGAFPATGETCDSCDGNGEAATPPANIGGETDGR